ncbi:cytochrome P450 [Microthyrium microscopicum]|uniref:Cytochrome P450 n=1 Tax=Microthyrium microscopicum TaxID=703497 RepID=A0A6A6UIB3_9PEZI|nr:cytochrome P450 [Microthyrium microscopicum]
MWFVEQIPLKPLQHFFNGPDRLYKCGTDAFNKYINLFGRTSNRKDIVARMLEKPAKGVEGLSDYLVALEIANLTFAATDTTSVVLTFLFWELARNSQLQTKLRTELQQVQVPENSNIPSHQSLVKLPLLNAVIQETMRRHSPVPMGLLRQVPPGGRSIANYFMPGETIVSMSSLTAHRNAEHFPVPDSFIPSRWLSGKSESDAMGNEGQGGTEAMKKLYMPFGKGTHKCVGHLMAMLSMRIIVATLVLKYEFKLGEDAKIADMDWDDHFLIILNRGCFLDLTPLA